MKALDTPVLIDLLCGSTGPRALIGAWKDQEVATTEINLFELELLAESAGRKGLGPRLAALERLRRRLTVLPVDNRALTASRSLREAGAQRLAPSARLIVSVLLANGCSEWHTTRTVSAPGRIGQLKVVEYRSNLSKKLK